MKFRIFVIVLSTLLLAISTIDVARSQVSSTAASISPNRVSGQVLLADGSPVADVRISAYGANDAEFISTFTDENGDYTFTLPAGNWKILLRVYAEEATCFKCSPPQIWFTENEEYPVFFADDEQVENAGINFVVSPATAKISGTIRKPDGTPAIGIDARIHAFSSQLADAEIRAAYDEATATFTADVGPGQWQIAYTLDESAEASYISYGLSESVAVSGGTPAEQDITLNTYDAVIRGTILGPGGSVTDVENLTSTVLPIWPSDIPDALNTRYTRREVPIVDGTFEFAASAGTEYTFTLFDSCYGGLSDKCERSVVQQQITATADGPTDVRLQIVAPDATITGTVRMIDTGKVVAEAQVSARSASGRELYVYSDENGAFEIPAHSAEIWYISAVTLDNLENIMEVEMLIDAAGVYPQDLVIIPDGSSVESTAGSEQQNQAQFLPIAVN